MTYNSTSAKILRAGILRMLQRQQRDAYNVWQQADIDTYGAAFTHYKEASAELAAYEKEITP